MQKIKVYKAAEARKNLDKILEMVEKGEKAIILLDNQKFLLEPVGEDNPGKKQPILINRK